MVTWKVELGNDQNQGTREEQQDYFATFNPADDSIMSKKGFLAVVADGMGGHTGGACASVLAVTRFVEEYKRDKPNETIPEALGRALAKANSAVYEANLSQGPNANMGTTLIACVLQANNLYWVSVGDSKILHYKNRQLIALNAEHSYGAELNKKLQQEEISKTRMELEASRRNRLTSYLGMDKIPQIDNPRHPLVLNKGEMVLLCTDGLINTLGNDEIASILSFASVANTQKICENLTKKVLEKKRPYQDNVTTVLLKPQSTGHNLNPRFTEDKNDKDIALLKSIKYGLAGFVVLALIAFIFVKFLKNDVNNDIAKETPKPTATVISTTVATQTLPSTPSPTAAVPLNKRSYDCKNLAFIQCVLKFEGFYVEKIDGVTGSNTRNALMKFKGYKGIADNTDKVDPETCSKLFEIARDNDLPSTFHTEEDKNKCIKEPSVPNIDNSLLTTSLDK